MKEFINDYYRLFCSKYAEDICRFVNGYDFREPGGEFSDFYEYSESSARMANHYWRKNKSSKFTMSEIWVAIKDLFYVMDYDFKDVFQNIIISLCDDKAKHETAKLAMTECEPIFKYVVYEYFCLPENPQNGKLNLGNVSYALRDFLLEHSSGYHFYWSIAILFNARNLACHKTTPKPLNDSDIFRLRILRYIISVVVGIVAILNKYKPAVKTFSPIREPLKVKIMTVASEDVTITDVAWGQDESEKKPIEKKEEAEIREFEIKIQRHKPIFFDIKYAHNGETKTASYSPSLDFNDNADYVLEICIPNAKYNCRFKKIDIVIPKDGKYKEIADSQVPSILSEEANSTNIQSNASNIDLCATEEYHITEEETAKLPVPDDTVTLDITSDLECSMTIPGVVQNCTVARNGNVTLRIPKGRHKITLTAKDNPSYVMTREVDLTCDTAIKDMLFAKEVRNHSEWWKTALQNIVVLKKTFCDGDNKFVLWDKTVDLPVYFCKCYNENGFGKCETGFAGNLFYVKEETGCYRYYDLTNNNDNILSGHLFTFAEKRRQCCEFTGYRGKGDALVIDKDGKELYRIFESKDWNESLIGLYEDFINKFEFSDGWAAMLKPDGTIVFINEDWMEDNESTYPFDSAYYPVFHDGWCAVKNGDGDYLFLRDMTSCIKADNNKYDLLQPVIVKDNWACISKTKNLYQIINPNSGEYLLSEAFQFIESSYGLFKIKLEDRWAILDSNLKDWVFPDTRLNDKVRFSTGEYHILTKDFYIQKGLNKSDGDKFVYISAHNNLLDACFQDFSLIYDSVCPSSANFIAVKKHDKKWFVFDAKGNEHLTGYDDFIYYKEGIFVIEKDGVYECWKAVGDKLFNICKAEWAFIDKDELFIYNTYVLPHIKDKKKDIANLRQFKVTPTENSWNLLQINKWAIEKSVHTINPFLSYAKDVHNVKGMEDSIAKISSDHVIHNYYRHGNLWIADDDEKKMIFSNSWKLLMDECDEITSVSENLYYVTNNGKAYFMDDTGTGIISIFYRIVRPIVNGFAAVYATAWGFVQINDGSIKEICVREYSEVKDFSKEGYAMVYKKNEGWGLIDSRGDLVVNCSYDEVEDFKNGCGYTSVRIGDSWKIIGKDGIEVSW